MKKNINLIELKTIADKSFPENRNRIGAVIFCEDGTFYTGFTIRRSSILGSTCAEKMALDNWFQGPRNSMPVKMILIGKIMRDGWDNSCVCYPCGSCRELFHQFTHVFKVKNFVFNCYSWDEKNKDIKNIKELLFYSKPFYE